MGSTSRSAGPGTRAIAPTLRVLAVALAALAWLGLSGGTAIAQTAAEAAKITQEQAAEIARKKVAGDVTDVAIERKLGANRWVVEVLSEEDGSEIDVIIDMESGEVLALDH